jgi:hypothetical protein
MADMMQIEQRLATLEVGLAQIRKQLGLTNSTGNWVDRVAGSLADLPEDEYQRFLECCRAVRDGATNNEESLP